MALTRVQATPMGSHSTPTVSLSFASPPTVGSAILVALNAWAGGTPTGCVDNHGNAYTLAGTGSNNAGSAGASIFYCPAITNTGSPFTLTVTSAHNWNTAIALEVSGVGAGLILDQTASAFGSSTTPTTGATAALTTAADAFQLASFGCNSALGSCTIGSAGGAWTEEYEQLATSFVAGETDSRVVASATGTTPAATWTTTGGAWGAVLAVFKAGAPVPPAPGGSLGGRLKLLISGVERTAWLANGYSIDIEKVLSSETFHLAILDLDSTAGAYRPSVGDDILLTRTDELGDDIELLFGGEIAHVVDEPIIDDSGTVTRIRCRDWMVLADQVFMPPRTYASATAREVFTAIVEEYLGPKGVIVITAPTGGPELPELRIEDFVTSVRQTLDRITLQAGWPWRINGEKWAALDDPLSLPGPATLSDDGQSVLTDPPLRWEQQVLTHATRVWVQTAAPEAGPGPYVYTETIVPPSGTSVVPVHVLPTEIRGSTTAAAESFDTTLALTGLPREASIRVGALLTIEWHSQVYTVTTATTTNNEGEATVSLAEGMERDVPEGHSVTFLRGAFVELELNGVVTPMDGSPYVWEPIENAIVYPAGDLGGDTVLYRTWALHPTMVREWDPVAQQAIGWFDYEHVIDQQITEEEGHTDLDTARTFAQAELAKRLTPPKRVTCTTRIPGHYPILLVPMNFPDRLVVGDYLVAETRIRHSTIDETSDEQPLLYELVLWEGDSLGESWIQYFRGRNPSQGIRWGAVPLVTAMQWTTNRQFTAPAGAAALSVTPSGVAWTNSAYVELTAATDTDWVLTGVVCVFPGGAGLFVDGNFEVDVAVGAAASEVVVATLKGRYLETGFVNDGVMRLPIPIDAIPSGARVALRMRMNHSNTTPWQFAITYLKMPITGNLQTTTQPSKVVPSAASTATVTASMSSWANSAWTQLIASAAADLVLVGVVTPASVIGRDWELDLGIGAAASEVVLMTIKGYHSTGGLASGPDYTALPNPRAGITSGSRVSARVRVSDTSGGGFEVALVYHEAPL